MLEASNQILGDEAILALINLFNIDVETAATYVGFKRDSLRKAWVRRELGR
jgi:hypothetical protein